MGTADHRACDSLTHVQNKSAKEQQWVHPVDEVDRAASRPLPSLLSPERSLFGERRLERFLGVVGGLGEAPGRPCLTPPGILTGGRPDRTSPIA